MSTPLVLFSIDRPNWCFDHIAKAVSKELAEFYRFKIMPHSRIASEDCDVLVTLCWERGLHSKSNTKCRAMVACLYDHLSWNINPEAIAHFKLTLRNSSIITVCNEQMKAELISKVSSAELPPVFLLEDGVDVNLFKPVPPPHKFACGWTGMSTRCTPGGPGDYKGLAMLQRACSNAGATLRVLDSAAGDAWPLQRMPIFYQDITVQLIGSAYEGTPNPLLEAMAMGRPVISTNVGLASKVIKHGVNGYLVDRTEEAFTAALVEMQKKTKTDLLEMGKKARQAVMPFSWTEKAKAWKQCLDVAKLGKAIARTNHQVQVLEPSKPFKVEEATVKPLPPPAPPPSQPAVDITATARVESTRRALKPGEKPRVLLISDVPDWAFHQNMKDLELYLSDRFEFDHWFVIDFLREGKVPDMDLFDVAFCVYHRWAISAVLPWDRTVGSLRAGWFWPENPGPIGQKEYDTVNAYRAFHVVVQEHYEALKDHCPNVVYLTNPINMDRFLTATQIEGEVIASWNGNAKHRSGAGDIKAFRSIIMAACETAGVQIEYAEYNTCRLSPAEMPAFYQKGNVALCASLYEGASNSVMESMASGLALISTAVGNIPEMQASQEKHFGESGIMLVDRTPHAFVQALRTLKADPARAKAMGEINREEIAQRWSWKVWADRYADYLRKAL